MGKSKKRHRAISFNNASAAPLGAGLDKYVGLICAAATIFIGITYWPSLNFPALSLDDSSLLKEFADKPFLGIFGYDHFGHLRPVKNLLFWMVSRTPEHLYLWRVTILCVFLLSAVIIQNVASDLLESRWWGLAAAICWALNPTTPSVVCWLSASNTTICLLGTLVYLRMGKRALSVGRFASSTSWIPAGAAIVGLLVALFSHELAVFAPVLLYVYWRTVRDPKAHPPLEMTLAIGTAVCILFLAGLYAINERPAIAYRSAAGSGWLLTASAARYLFENILLWFWHTGRFGVLLVDTPADHLYASAISWLLLLTVCALYWRFLRRDASAIFCLIWLAAFLVPMTNLVPFGNTPVAVHYLYLPSVGLSLLLCRAAQQITLQTRILAAKPAAFSPVAFTLLCLAAWLPEQMRSVTRWSDSEHLYSATVRNYPTNVEARVNLSSVYLNKKRYADAATLIERSLRLAPQERGLIGNRLEMLWQTGQDKQALDLLDASPFMNEGVHAIRRGMLLERLHRYEESVQAYERAFQSADNANDRFRAGYRLATMLMQVGRVSDAKQLVERLLREYPGRQELVIAKRLLSE